MALTDDLQSIEGVGPATAEKIVALVETDADGWTERAKDELSKGNEDRALTYLKRSL